MTSPTATLDVRVSDSVFDPREKRRTVRRKTSESGRPLYQVRLFLEGYDLPYVRAVTYHLHSTFRNRVQRVERTAANQNCKLEIWTWGIFEAKAVIEDKAGREHVRTHMLTYGNELEGGVDAILAV